MDKGHMTVSMPLEEFEAIQKRLGQADHLESIMPRRGDYLACLERAFAPEDCPVDLYIGAGTSRRHIRLTWDAEERMHRITDHTDVPPLE